MTKVAVLIPTTEGRAEMLEQAVASVLRQSVPNWKLLVWGDGYQPSAADWPSDLRVMTPRWSATQNGEAASRNELMRWWRTEHPDCELACWLDDDDIMSMHRLLWQAGYMEADPGVAISFCIMGVFHGDDGAMLANGGFEIQPARTVDVTRYDSSLRSYRNNLATPTGMFRPVVAEVPFDVSVRTGGCDLLWLYTLRSRGLNVGYVQRQLYYLRQHEERLTMVRRRTADSIVQADLARFNAAAERVRAAWQTS